MDNVNNRSLFRRKSQAARNKVREMGMVPQEPRPQGILASFSDLMEVAGRNRKQGLMPQVMQQMRPMQRMPMQVPMAAQQPPPVRMQMGGDVAMEAYRQGAAEPTLGQQYQAAQASALGPGVDIGATPTPRAPVENTDISALVRARLGDNPEAQARFDQLEEAVSNPDVSAEQVQEDVTDAAGVENTTENFRRVTEQITGIRLPSSATVDEINNAITGVALGGAIGGPRSVAERISNALLVGLQAKRETATAREALEGQIAVARAGADAEGASPWLESAQGKAALELYQKYIESNYSHADAITEMDRLSPGLGATLQQAMGENRPGAAPAAAPAQAPTGAPQAMDEATALDMARQAIDSGRDRAVVEQMLTDMGIDPSKL